MASRFRLNRYNWLCQKLLAQHDYDELFSIRQHLEHQAKGLERAISEQVEYLHGLALMKTSSRFDELIHRLQCLDFEKNSQYFLLLCQCLLFTGNHDAVIALCKRAINQAMNLGVSSRKEADEGESSEQSADKEADVLIPGIDPASQDAFEALPFTESARNRAVNEPKLWLIFAASLEYRGQLKSAQVAHHVATRLANSGSATRLRSDNQNPNSEHKQPKSVSYNLPQERYAEFCLRHTGDLRPIIHLLGDKSSSRPRNFTLDPILALAVSLQPSNQGENLNYSKALDIIASLEAFAISNKNPSAGYNHLAMQFQFDPHGIRSSMYFSPLRAHARGGISGDEGRCNLNFLLEKAHISLNSIIGSALVQDRSVDLYKHINDSKQESSSSAIIQIEKSIESMRNSDEICWASSSLWNNLGLCYLMKRRFIACISCLLKAHQMSPLDWRINYNLALACLHIGLTSRSLNHLHASRAIQLDRIARSSKLRNGSRPTMVATSTLLAIAYEKLGCSEEARRLHIETSCVQPGMTGSILFSLVNYLIHLHSRASQSDVDHKIQLHILDQIEQNWLQRDQRDSQYNSKLLSLASRIGNEISSNTNRTYAWTKFDISIER